jgi:hypothetical protein
MIDSACRHEMNGDWERARELYASVAAKFNGQPLADYANNCIQRLHEKQLAGRAEEGR